MRLAGEAQILHKGVYYQTCGEGSSGEDDVVDGDEDELDDVADETHNDEAHGAGLKDLHVLGTARLLALLEEVLAVAAEFLHLSDDALRLAFLSLSGHLD